VLFQQADQKVYENNQVATNDARHPRKKIAGKYSATCNRNPTTQMQHQLPNENYKRQLHVGTTNID